MSAFNENSPFLDSANDHRIERLREDPYSPIPPGPGVPVPTGPNQHQLERWYTALTAEVNRATIGGRTRQSHDETQRTLQEIADEIYSYLRG
jgi:hypothetical protein